MPRNLPSGLESRRSPNDIGALAVRAKMQRDQMQRSLNARAGAHVRARDAGKGRQTGALSPTAPVWWLSSGPLAPLDFVAEFTRIASVALRTGLSATRVPALRRRSSNPVSASARSARFTVARAQLNSIASSASLGMNSPGFHSRALIRRSTSACTVCQLLKSPPLKSPPSDPSWCGCNSARWSPA